MYLHPSTASIISIEGPMLDGSFSVLTIVTALATIVVCFDGSLKNPSDPGFAVVDRRMAACAACIFVVEEERDPDSQQQQQQATLMGGKLLRNASSSALVATSGAVEYEGLILGLEGLRTFLMMLEEHSSSMTIDTVIIQGDCKTVLEQMAGTARPRKLQDYHQRATQMISSSLASSLDHVPITIEYQFIPRSQNVVCDRMCARMLLDQQQEAHRLAVRQLRDMLQTMMLSQSSSSRSSHEHAIPEFLSVHLSPEQSLIPYSKRPDLYRHLVQLAAASNDWVSLLFIGKQMQFEVETVWTRADVNAVEKGVSLPVEGSAKKEDSDRQWRCYWSKRSCIRSLLSKDKTNRKKSASWRERNAFF